MKLLYWRAFPVQRGGKHYYRVVWKLFGKNGIPVWWWWDKLDPLPRAQHDQMRWCSHKDNLQVCQDLALYGNAVMHIASINGELIVRRLDIGLLPDGSQKADIPHK